jgi:hypothetical protein
MSDDLLDVLRAIARRRTSQSGEIEHSIEKNNERNQKTHQTVKFFLPAPSEATWQAVPQTVCVSSEVSKAEDFCGLEGADQEYEGCEKNEKDEVIRGRISSSGEWAAALSQLPLTRTPGDASPLRWRQFVDDAGRLLRDGTLDEAIRLGWTPLDLCGCDRSKPFARIDQMGLIWFIRGGRVDSVSRSAAIIETVAGARQTYRRKTQGIGQVVVWELFNAVGKSAEPIGVNTARMETSGA